MKSIYVLSGPCGAGKSTLAEAWAAQRVNSGAKNQVYVIHGDDFHRGFVETARRVGPDCPGFLYWADILRFNWECIIDVARKALGRGLDVIIDYVVEDELPLLCALAQETGAQLYFTVLTASREELAQRLIRRGSGDLVERSRFLKEKFDQEPLYRPYLTDITGMTVEQALAALNWEAHAVPLG